MANDTENIEVIRLKAEIFDLQIESMKIRETIQRKLLQIKELQKEIKDEK